MGRRKKYVQKWNNIFNHQMGIEQAKQKKERRELELSLTFDTTTE
jgi:hypothetical protein